MIKEIEDIIYIKIDNSVNFIIDEKEAKTYIKENVYHTIGFDDLTKIVIFDLEKNSIIPEIKYMDGFTGGSLNTGGVSYIGGGIFIAILVAIFVYMNFTKESTEISTPLVSNPIISTGIPQIENKPVEVKINTEISDKNIIIGELEKENFNLYNNNALLGNDIEILNKRINGINEELVICENKVFKYKLEVTELEEKNISLKEDLNFQNSLNLESNQLFLSIGEDIFKRCQENNVGYCSEYLFEFYNIRELNNGSQ